MRKVKNCSGCIAHTPDACLLKFSREMRIECHITANGNKYVNVWSPVNCCHKPKTIKDFTARLQEVCKNGVNYV